MYSDETELPATHDPMHRDYRRELPDPDEQGVQRVPRSRGDIEKLKQQWEIDPTWDIEDTEGFEAHRDELATHRRLMEARWQAHEENRLAMERQAYGEDWLRQAKCASRNASPADAHLFAAIAQAEALTRIAEVLETMLEDGVTPAGREALGESVRIWGGDV